VLVRRRIVSGLVVLVEQGRLVVGEAHIHKGVVFLLALVAASLVTAQSSPLLHYNVVLLLVLL